MSQGMSNFTYIKIKSEDISRTIGLIGGKIRELVPNDPFVHYFLDEEMNKLYRVEKLTGKLTGYVSFLAIFISCLGLLALASFSVERRTKEIGIRKVLGSSVPQIIFMLTKDFTRWVILANLFAWPIAYFVLTKWLANFAFRTGIEWWIFFMAGTMAIIIAMIVVSYQTIRAATANPVKALRYE